MSNNSTEDLLKGVMRFGPNILDHCLTSDDLSQYINHTFEEHLDYPIPPKIINSNVWFIPAEYQTMDIEGYLVNQCPKENYQRLIEELQEFRTRNMLPLLRALKYLIDTLRTNNIIWGVGRGSSVASYVLFLLGVHKIDSIKYNLDWHEFLR